MPMAPTIIKIEGINLKRALNTVTEMLNLKNREVFSFEIDMGKLFA